MAAAVQAGAGGQTNPQALLPGVGSIIAHDLLCARVETFIASQDWRAAYMSAGELHATHEVMYHKARRPAFNRHST